MPSSPRTDRARRVRTATALALATKASAPLLGGAALAIVVVSFAGPAPIERPPAPIGGARLRGLDATDCAPCHAREVAQWRASAMALAARSPLVGALESLVEEQVGRDATCPNGAGALRDRGPDACVDPTTGIAITGAGGEDWCVNCHAPGDNLRRTSQARAGEMPPWSARGRARDRLPMQDLLSTTALEGVSCAVCHSTIGPVAIHAARARTRAYEGNPTWTSIATGLTFSSRPEDSAGVGGIANSGYRLDVDLMRAVAPATGGRVHAAPPGTTERYLASSEFCGACHDVRLFGTDTRSGPSQGEHFKRLRNAYSEWRAWAEAEARAGRRAPGCQDCHMSLYPGVCEPSGSYDRAGEAEGSGCPGGTRFAARAPGTYAVGRIAPSSAEPAARLHSHWFTGVELPLSDDLPDALVDDVTLDADGVPVGVRARRDMLLEHTFRFELGEARLRGAALEIPVVLENVGAGHRVPAGFSQEREVWVELVVGDARGDVVYDVGRLARPDSDLGDKRLLRVTSDASRVDARGRPEGLFGADVVDGPDAPAWSPDLRRPASGAESVVRFVGRGLVNLQNGFERCVRCVGVVDASGACQPGPGQDASRGGRFADGDYDPDTGACRSNLAGDAALFETYFPVGALDAQRGVVKAPDAIIDTRSAPPGVPLEYTYVIDTRGHPRPFTIHARLLFRAFPPYLVRAFAAYERAQAARGLRPGGAQVNERMLRRDEPIELARAEERVP